MTTDDIPKRQRGIDEAPEPDQDAMPPTGGWFHFSHYDEDAGFIRPCSAKIVSYDPWSRTTLSGKRRTPWEALDALDSAFPAGDIIPDYRSGEWKQRAVGWTNRFGPLGLMLTRCDQLILPSEGNKQTTFVRTPLGYLKREKRYYGSAPPPPDCQWTPNPYGSEAPTRRGTVEVYEDYFPHEAARPGQRPCPMSEAWIRGYSEHVRDWTIAAKTLVDCARLVAAKRSPRAKDSEQRKKHVSSVAFAHQMLANLVTRISPRSLSLSYPYRMGWNSPSLEVTLGLMALLGPASGRGPRHCDHCGSLFVGRREGARFCSISCKDVAVQRAYRLKRSRNA